ncbi:hypothetical protein N8I77_001464 [Diaporthe amygdali]|uniref:F-box domain-containing protein n=1 Tax=Phomopsis amygdali TaxID=1214568 RepID=A0AAD9W9F0_PHOAM|nr:hypothetical protein N8I77_001464 [Diaporthe amygdali]
MADTVDHLARLPAKLLDQIAKDCLSPKDVASLTMTSSHYAAMVIPILRKKRTRDEWADPYRPSTIQTSAAVVSGDTQGPDYLAKLPAEILLHIAEDSCLSTRDLANFARTSSRYTDIVISVLYKKNIREENSNAFLWATIKQSTNTLALLIRNGADINNVDASMHLDEPSPYQWVEHLRNWNPHAETQTSAARSLSFYEDDSTSQWDDRLSNVPSSDQVDANYAPATSVTAISMPATTTPPTTFPASTMPVVSVPAAPMPAAQVGAYYASAFLAPLPLTFMPATRTRSRPEAPRKFKYTPLALAARRGRAKAVRWLLENGADTEIPARDLCGCDNELQVSRGMWRIRPLVVSTVERPEWTALHLAVHYNHSSIVQLLISHSANTQQICRVEDGPCTVLHTAFAHKRKSIIESLIYGLQGTNMVEINAKGRGGITPLHLAYCMRDEALIELALKFGAYINLEYDVDGNQWTLFSMACAQSDWAFALRLLKLGANPDFDLARNPGWRLTTQDFIGSVSAGCDDDRRALRDEIDHIKRDQEVARL